MKRIQLKSLFSEKVEGKSFCYVVMAISFVFLLTACGGSDDGGLGSSATGNTAVPDACSLLTESDIETVLGGPISAIGDVDEEGDFSTCTWLDQNSGERLALNIWGAGNAEDGWATQFLSGQAAAAGYVSVANLGDEAYTIVDGDQSNYYWRIDDAFVVVFTSTATAASQDALLDLARKIDGGF